MCADLMCATRDGTHAHQRGGGGAFWVVRESAYNGGGFLACSRHAQDVEAEKRLTEICDSDFRLVFVCGNRSCFVIVSTVFCFRHCQSSRNATRTAMQSRVVAWRLTSSSCPGSRLSRVFGEMVRYAVDGCIDDSSGTALHRH